MRPIVYEKDQDDFSYGYIDLVLFEQDPTVLELTFISCLSIASENGIDQVSQAFLTTLATTIYIKTGKYPDGVSLA